MVEVNGTVYPGQVVVHASVHIGDDLWVGHLTRLIYTLHKTKSKTVQVMWRKYALKKKWKLKKEIGGGV